MKTITITIITIIVTLAACMLCTAMTTNTEQPATCMHYALTTCVVEVDRDNDIVTCEDYNGNLWEFYGAEDWEVGDCASLLMYTRGTLIIYDDEVQGARCGGYTITR